MSYAYDTIAGYAHRLGGEVVRGDQVLCPGPGHSAKDRSLSVWFQAGDSFAVHSHVGDDVQTCKDHVRALCGFPAFAPGREGERQERTYRAHRNEKIETQSEIDRRKKAGRIWRESVDPRGTLVEQYLHSRGLLLPDDVAMRVIRFHPSCPWQDGEVSLRVPAMICRYQPIGNEAGIDSEVTAIHRTRLREDGSGHAGKKMIGSPLGQCVKLSPDWEIHCGLHIAEGIETALACYAEGFVPIFATTTAGIMGTFPVLPGVDCLTILIDRDTAGGNHGQTCAERYQAAGREVYLRLPPKWGKDFADEADDDR